MQAVVKSDKRAYMDEKELKGLIQSALQARQNAYCPYSGFAVGAALLSEEGEVFGGCNVENVSFGATICAERNAFFHAVSTGKRSFRAIAIVGGPVKNAEVETYAYPCGMCRQVMTEFCQGDFLVIVAKSVSDYLCFPLKELMPCSFDSIE